MTRILLIGDVHLADRPPSVRTETYTDDILAKLQFAVEEAARQKVDCIVQGGDMFHLKAPTRNSHSLVQRTHEVLTSAGIPAYIVPGNHDMSSDRLDSLKKQPLGSLARMAGVDLLLGPHPDLPIFGLPYLQDWMADLPRWMKKYEKWADEQKGRDFDFWPLMITHAPIFPPGEEPPYEFIGADDWVSLMHGKGDCFYSHIHDPHGAYLIDDAVMMCNNGAISRGSLHEKTLKRKPAVTLWDTEQPRDHRFTRIEVPHRPAESVFRLHEKVDADEKSSRVEEFLAEVGSTTLDGLSLEEVREHARSQNLSMATLALVEELLEGAL
jgi:DNA repair exonuclease SbcCD nuclease subunit